MTDPTNNSADELIQHLAAADPLDHDALPSATDPSARKLLETTMTSQNSDLPLSTDVESNRGHASAGTPAEAGLVTDAVDPSQFHFDHSPAPKRRGRGLLVGAAAAVLLLVGGLLVFAPDNTPSAVATVHSAASTTLEADTARITTDFTLAGSDGIDEGQVTGRFDAAYSDDDLSFSVDFSQFQFEGPEEGPTPDDIPISEARLVDDILYAEMDGQWLAVDTEGLFGNIVNQFVDPRTVLETVQELSATTEIGPADIDGVATTHYQSIVDLGDETLSQSGWMAFEGVAVDAEGEVTIDLFVDENGVLRQLNLSGDVRDGENSAETGTFEVATHFYDIGADFTIEAPEGVEPIDALQGLFSDE
jgi:hypothetical protein